VEIRNPVSKMGKISWSKFMASFFLSGSVIVSMVMVMVMARKMLGLGQWIGSGSAFDRLSFAVVDETASCSGG
jgi:hypothetical protein